MSITLELLALILGFSVFMWVRIIWYLSAAWQYHYAVAIYLLKDFHRDEIKKFSQEEALKIHKDNLEYFEIWPVFPMMIRAYDWDFRNFVVRQDLHDDVIQHFYHQQLTKK